MYLARSDLEAEPVDRPHAAKIQPDVRKHDCRPIAVLARQLWQQFRARRYLTMLLHWPTVPVVQQVRDPAGDGQHDNQQKPATEKRRPGYQGCCEFGQYGKDDGTEQWAEDRPAAADQDGDEEQDRQVESEGVRRDVGL